MPATARAAGKVRTVGIVILVAFLKGRISTGRIESWKLPLRLDKLSFDLPRVLEAVDAFPANNPAFLLTGTQPRLQEIALCTIVGLSTHRTSLTLTQSKYWHPALVELTST